MSSQDLCISGEDDGYTNFPDGKLADDVVQPSPAGFEVRSTISQQYAYQNAVNSTGNTVNDDTRNNGYAMLDKRITERINAIRNAILRDRPQTDLHELNGRAKEIAEQEFQSERMNEVGFERAAQELQQYLTWKHQVVSKDLLQAQLASQTEELNRARVDRETRDREMARMQELLRIESAKN